MTPAEEKYVVARARVIARWPLYCLMLLGLTGWMYWYLYAHYRLYVDHNYLLAQLQAYKVDGETLDRMAVVGNMAFVACGAFIAIILVLLSLALWQEWRILNILRRQTADLMAKEAMLGVARAKLAAREEGGA